MLFIIRAEDQKGALDRRLALRPRHVEYLQSRMDQIKVAGAILDEAGNPCGSMLVVDVADQAAAEEFARSDPFSIEGVFASFTVAAYRPAFGSWQA